MTSRARASASRGTSRPERVCRGPFGDRLSFGSAESDLDLVERAQAQDGRAMEALLARYEPFARDLGRSFFIPGHEYEDVRQIARLGLLEAIVDYRAGTGVPFSRYAWVCARWSVINALKVERRGNRRFLTEAISTEVLRDKEDSSGGCLENGADWHPAFAAGADGGGSPVSPLPPAPEIWALPAPLVRARPHLSAMEWEACVAVAEGELNRETAARLSCSAKRVSNAWERAKVKLRALPVWEDE